MSLSRRAFLGTTAATAAAATLPTAGAQEYPPGMSPEPSTAMIPDEWGEFEAFDPADGLPRMSYFAASDGGRQVGIRISYLESRTAARGAIDDVVPADARESIGPLDVDEHYYWIDPSPENALNHLWAREGNAVVEVRAVRTEPAGGDYAPHEDDSVAVAASVFEVLR